MPSNDLLSGSLFVFIRTRTGGHFWSNCSICVLHMRSSGNAQSSKVCSNLLHLLNSSQTKLVHLCFPSEGTELSQQLQIFSTHWFLCRICWSATRLGDLFAEFTMQLGLLEAGMRGRICSPNLTSSRLRQGAGCRPGAHLVPLRRAPSGARIAAVELSSSASLCSQLAARGGLLALPVLPKSRPGVVRVEASGAYSREAFVSEGEASKLAQVSKRLERTAGYFKRLGQLGFWGQLVCTVVAAVILAFSVVITGQATAPVSTYLTAGGIAAAFLSVFWSFGYIRLSHKLREAISDPTKAPPRAEVVKKLKSGIVINLLGLGSALLGLQATVGVLVAKALTSSSTPYLQGAPQGFSPVLALDVFLVQASGNALLAHFLGLVFALELLRSVTLSQPPPPDSVIPKAA